MKFIYEYRTRENNLCRGEVRAGNREAAFALLRREGVKPARLCEAPGVLNLMLGKGKRWIAIVVLAAVASGAVFQAVSAKRVVKSTLDAGIFAKRSQIYGDPGVLRHCFENGWTNVFTNVCDCALAAYGIPGRQSSAADFDLRKVASCPGLLEFVPILNSDLEECAKMKRIVNGMKQELSEYLDAGGSVDSYFRRLEKRQRFEVRLYQRIKAELEASRDNEVWQIRNSSLRSMGLPMISVIDED